MTEQKFRTITQDEFNAMTPDEQNNVLLKMVKLEGTGVVRDAAGNIKYDNPADAGKYGELDEPQKR